MRAVQRFRRSYRIDAPTGEAGAIEYLDPYFIAMSPSLTAAPEGQPPEVALDIAATSHDGQSFARLVGDIAARGTSTHGILHLPADATVSVESNGRSIRSLHLPSNVVYEIDLINPALTIHTSNNDPPACPYSIARAIRAFSQFDAHIGESRRLHLHGALVSTSAGGVLLVGETRAGKTTLLLQLLRAGAAYVSNSSATVDDTARGFGWPQAVGIRRDVLPFFGRLEKYVSDGRGRYPFNRPGSAEYVAEKVKLTPKEFVAVLGSVLVPDVQLALVAQPVFDPLATEASISVLSHAAAVDLIVAHVLPSRYESPWHASGEASFLARELASEIALRTTAVRVSHGATTPDRSPHLLSELMAIIAASTAE